MTVYKINKGRAIRASIEGNFDIFNWLSEGADNHNHGNATELAIRVLPIKNKKTNDAYQSPIRAVVIADNGVTPMNLDDDLEWGVDSNNPANNIGDFGVGIKAASLAVAKTADFITRDAQGNISFARLERDKIYANPPTYINPAKGDALPPDVNPSALWDAYAVDKNGTGTMIMISDVTDETFKSCGSLVEGIRLDSPGRPSVRYSKLISNGALTIKTGVNGGALKVLDAADFMGLTIPGVKTILNTPGYYAKKNCNFDIKMTKIPPGTKGASQKGGIYVEVCDIVMYLDRERWLGMFERGTSHSYRWQLRGLISFADKTEFKKVFGFTAHKHTISYDHPSFGDWMRDAKGMFGQTIAIETNEEKERVRAKELKAKFDTIQKEDDAFVSHLGKTIPYGSNLALRNYSTMIKGFGVRDVTNPISTTTTTAVFNTATGFVEWNPNNSRMSTWLAAATSSPSQRATARAIAAADALVGDLRQNNITVSATDYATLVQNLVWVSLD